jgi:hypothetical protein
MENNTLSDIQNEIQSILDTYAPHERTKEMIARLEELYQIENELRETKDGSEKEV